MPRPERALAVLAATLLTITPSPAGAAPATGTVTFTPAASIALAAIKVHTSGGCPAPADGFYATARGHGFPPDGQIVTAPTAAGMSRTAGFDVWFAQTMADFATDNHTALSGRYDVTVSCVDSFKGAVFAQYTGALVFTSPTSYQSGATASTAAPAAIPAALPAASPAAVPRSFPWWLPVTGLATVLLAFETGRRFGRRSRHP
ncbi:hypothetical protein [Actinoplanes palleronii]|uniref:Secreted protein n=1 Tax=Actinoplanes palleronii TaxID=113570 RepID=A0ABQ4B6C8_9ACTN|nr:hypothetical protein [Actinoplanes palleronii]GIE66227.1 hypothetical protein Apa02nite_023350 [Actinoplanes palleronii]